MGSEGNGDRVLIGGEDNNWDPLVSLNQSGNFGNHSTLVNLHSPMGCVSSSSSPHLLHFPSDSSLVGIVPKVPNFGSQVFPEMGNSYCPIPESGSSPNFENKCQSPEGGKRKRKVPIGASPKSGEEQHKEDDEKNQSNNGAETYIHVRAKRGQATNSHSLAERVRREKISERMRLLQELVPGCNKITGKALMLDEIINYVQSLQQQVEFLSMKLATVNPELNLDIDKILSKDLLHLRGSNSSALGIVSGPSSAHQPFHGYPFNGAPPFLPLPPQLQHIWNNELQGINQIGFDPDPDPSACSLGSNGKFASTY